MRSSWLRASLVVFGVIGITVAKTPPGFTPVVNKTLAIEYAGKLVPIGKTERVKNVQSVPNLAIHASNSSSNKSSSSSSKKFLTIMLDLSVNLGNGTPNTTLLHWIRPSLELSTTTNNTKTKNGISSNKDLTALTSTLPATTDIAPYFAPGPPAGQTHTYILLLYKQPAETFVVPADYKPFFANLTASVFNRVGFDLANFTKQAGLGEPFAAGWFLVSSNQTATGTASATTSATASAMTTTMATSGTASIISALSPTTGAPTTTGGASGPATTSSGIVRVSGSEMLAPPAIVGLVIELLALAWGIWVFS